MKYQILHRTVYEYSSEVSVSQHIARLTPRSLPHQRCLRHQLIIDPAPAEISQREDYFGNATTFFTLAGSHRALTVTARSELEVDERSWPVPAATAAWDLTQSKNAPTLPLEAQEYLFSSSLVPTLPALKDYAKGSFHLGRPLLEAVLELTAHIHADFTFDPKATTVVTPLEQVIGNRRGVCQDFAHFQIGCLRAVGVPARYVSGYLETLPPAGKPKLVGCDASHAWVQVFVPETGWVDVDPTNNMLSSDRHIVLAWGRDFDDVSPIRGVIGGGGKHTLNVAVDVTSDQTENREPKPPFKAE